MIGRRVWLLLPAFDEEGNLGPLLEDVRKVAASWPAPAPHVTVVVVDDGSRDNTLAVARTPRPGLDVTVLPHGVNQGLGAAMRTGITHVLAHGADDDVLFAMDADHTHPPESMPRMLDLVRGGADMVIASRFQPGAEVHGLDALRRFVSWAASWVLRAMFPGARDYTCGYRAYRLGLVRDGAERLGPDFLNQRGFSVMVDLLLKLRRQARRIEEVPLILRYDRKQGASKMKLMRTAWTTLRLLGRRFVGNPRGP
ncbi:MAG: glycosyltransferase [Planctomycetota bacterium]